MPEDLIRYDILVQDALRGVVRKVLSECSRTGLPGEHHFFITFLTKAPGVRISSRLLAQYPEEMTIILQHQFWDLTVSETAFEVGLSFNNIAERLLVPFGAIKSFVDPSVQFGLQFELALNEEAAANEDEEADTGSLPASPLPTALAPQDESGEEKTDSASADDAGEEKPKGEAQIVSLDAFRKK